MGAFADGYRRSTGATPVEAAVRAVEAVER